MPSAPIAALEAAALARTAVVAVDRSDDLREVACSFNLRPASCMAKAMAPLMCVPNRSSYQEKRSEMVGVDVARHRRPP
jgi:hypothetical protein